MYHHSYDQHQDDPEVIRYLSWRQKRRIVAFGMIIMTFLGYILAANG
jgi:fatty acid desaturase